VPDCFLLLLLLLLLPPADIFIVDLACNIYIIPDAAYKQLTPTKNMNTTCRPRCV
jgi:hypothetical protein